jgi:uncharacterized protein (DUF2062 family)
MKRFRLIFTKAFAPIRSQLMQGADASGLALSCGVGAAIAMFPIFGVTTLLCLIVGLIFRLNQPTLQAVNYAMAPVQLLLIPIFGYAASRLGHEAPIDINPASMISSFMSGPLPFIRTYGVLGLKAIFLWSLVAPLVICAVFWLCKNPIERLQKRRR